MEEPRPAKKPRLSMACNECRRRKVKCDADYPQCRNCAQRQIDCFTTDPKRPGVPIVREWIEDKASSTITSTNTTSTSNQQPQRQAVNMPHPAVTVNGNPGRAPHNDSSNDNSRSNATNAEDPSHLSPSRAPAGPTNEVSPVHNPYDMSFHLERNTDRIKMLGASSSQCLMKSLDVYLQLANIKSVTGSFKYGMRHAEEMALPLAISLPALPEQNDRARYMNVYFTRIHVLWPVFDIDATKSTLHALAAVPNLGAITHEQVPLLVTAYLIMSLGADEDAQRLTADGDRYLQAATSLLGHLIMMPYLGAVQSLILFTIAYRGRNKDGLAWQTAGMAVRIAHTLGLHRHSAIRPSDQHGIREKALQLFHARNWAVCCCLEKLIQLESGRPSAIINLDKDQMMSREQRAPGHDFLQWNMELAELQSEIGQHIYGHRPGDRTAAEILQNTARVDRALLSWSNHIPHEFHPDNAIYCSNDEFHFAAFFCVQFHQAMIALHRAALIAPRGTFDAEVERFCSDDPSKYRLQRGEMICVNSARSIIRVSLELSERNAESRLLSAGPPLLASTALAIFLMKHPRAKMQAADLELLKAAAEHTSELYIKSGQDRRMAQGLLSMYEKVRLHLRQGSTSQKRTRNDTGNTKIPQDTPSSKASEPTSTENNSDTTGMAQRQQGAAGEEGQARPQSSAATAYLHGQGPPSSASRNHKVVSDAIPHADQHGNQWLPISQDQHLMHANDNFSDGLGFSPDAYDVPNVGQLPFMNYNVEEMWNWMFLMDSTDHTAPLSAQDTSASVNDYAPVDR